LCVDPIILARLEVNRRAGAGGHSNISDRPILPNFDAIDYRSQGQTIPHVIVDIGAVPYGKLTPFNVYIALSRSSGWETIRLLRDFEESLFTTTPCVVLEEEDKRLEMLDRETYDAWKREQK